MKKNRTTRLVVLVLFLAIVTAVIISGTFAKYTESVSGGQGTAQIAKWSFKANGLGTVTRTDGVTADMIVADKLAPGTSGNFSATVDCTGCEVSVDYQVVISNVQNKPTNLKFYSDKDFTNEIPVSEGKYIVKGTIAANAAEKSQSVPVYWKWAYETTDGDSIDTTEGKAAVAMTFDISVVGTQSNPTPTATPAGE